MRGSIPPIRFVYFAFLDALHNVGRAFLVHFASSLIV